MNPNNDYIPVECQPPFKGLAKTPTSTRLDPAYSPELQNCVIREDGLVRRRAGYTQLGRRLVGRVMAMAEFGSLTEDPYFVVLTSHRQYYYDPVTQDFIDLTPGQQSWAVTDVGVNYFKVAGDKTLDLVAGRLIPVVGGLNEGVYTIVSSSFAGGKTTVNVTEPLLNTVTANGYIVAADDLTTGATDQIDFDDVTDISGRRLIMTNGQDPPRYWTGNTSLSFNVWAPAFTDFVTCKTIRVFTEHLMLGGIVTTSLESQVVAWSKAGDFEDFDSGDSGTQILYQLTKIVAMEILGDRLAIYSNDALMTAVFVDLPAVFAFEVVIPHGLRFVGMHGLVSINVGHVYLSEQNIYLFDGTRGLRILGNLISTDYQSVKDQEHLYLVASINDYARETLYFAVPALDGGAVIYTMRYDIFDLSNTTWCKETYAHMPRCFGFFTNRTETVTWEDTSWEPAGMPWADEYGTWGEEANQLSFPIRSFGTGDGDVFLMNEGMLNDDGTGFDQVYDTMDFTIPETFHSLYGRWGEVEFEAMGSTVDVSVSLDQGQSYQALETVTLSPSPTYYRIPFDKPSRTLRVRFKSAQDFVLRWIRPWVRPGGPR